MCGKYSAGGNTEAGHCINADPQGNTLPCQAGFGSCQIIPPPSCGTGSGTASNGRKIGYYQVANVRSRACNRAAPWSLNTKGFTQLNLAFASIDPNSYSVILGDASDESMYYAFTDLKSRGLQTWVSIGGFDFSDPGPTHTTWSDLVASASNRAAFISSLVNFMKKYGFQGADLDWEYPTAPERGGRASDAANYVTLVKEMRAAFGTSYGLSVVLAPDYWYLRGMDPKSMEPYVDHFGFMSYDLHGAWDGKNPTLGPKIRAQTDVREIYNDTKPLWFAGLNPAKINFGLAYYGRGYTVANTGCNTLGCTFSGPSKAASCTNFEGVMSNKGLYNYQSPNLILIEVLTIKLEIQSIISSKGVQPNLLSGPMIKELKWDDQWMGYDDADTFAMKLGVANDLCMGGSMVWSVDFDPNILEWSPAPANETFNPVQAQQAGFFTAQKGDAVLVVSNAVKIPNLGKYQYQYNLYGVRKGQTFDKDSNSINDGISGPLDPTIVGSNNLVPAIASSLPAKPSLQPRPTFKGFTWNQLVCNIDPVDTDPSIWALSMTCGSDLAGAESVKATVPCVPILSPITPILMGLCNAGYCSSLGAVCYMPAETSLNPRANTNVPGASRFITVKDFDVQWFIDIAKAAPGFTSVFYTQINDWVPGAQGLSDEAKKAAKEVFSWVTIWQFWDNPDFNSVITQFGSFYGMKAARTGDNFLANIVWRGSRDVQPPWNHPQNLWFRCMSAAYAMLATSTTVFVLTQTPNAPKMTNIFYYVEWLVLTGSGGGYVDPQTGKQYKNPNVRRVIATNIARTVFYVLWDLDDPTMKDARVSWKTPKLFTPPQNAIGPRDFNFEGSCLFNPVDLPGQGCDGMNDDPERDFYNGRVWYDDFFG
ncbi:hypothetical protein TWF694_007865 [Orbilia ellipsospora]|uniref:chitinase n=1 Tax=Orbilia ellipsospora TaxID=2528407 RepID=A0AAV9XKH1_9PEZI